MVVGVTAAVVLSQAKVIHSHGGGGGGASGGGAVGELVLLLLIPLLSILLILPPPLPPLPELALVLLTYVHSFKKHEVGSQFKRMSVKYDFKCSYNNWV